MVYWNGYKLPSFERIGYLRKMSDEGKFNAIETIDGEEIGFFILDGTMFKSLFLIPEYRRQGIGTSIVKFFAEESNITIATTIRTSPMRKIVTHLGFKRTNKIVNGKQSKLEIWEAN
jgi:GNAT superfamily N-acetyltransferase